MVVVVERFVPAALHFGQEGTSRRSRVAQIHVSVVVAAHAAHNLGLAEDTLGWKCDTVKTKRKFPLLNKS